MDQSRLNQTNRLKTKDSNNYLNVQRLFEQTKVEEQFQQWKNSGTQLHNPTNSIHSQMQQYDSIVDNKQFRVEEAVDTEGLIHRNYVSVPK